jgi:pyruvate formate lyase activating enzyme
MDFPGKLAAMCFTQGCNLKCPYCHNPSLNPHNGPELEAAPLSANRVLEVVKRHAPHLDGLVISGGEPTVQPELASFIQEARQLNLAIKLDTNGTRPHVLEQLLAEGVIDYIAMDIKAPPEPAKYAAASGTPVNLSHVRESVRLIQQSGLPHEFRTTIVQSLHTLDDVLAIGDWVAGAPLYALQRFQCNRTYDETFAQEETWPEAQFEAARELLAPRFGSVVVR